MARKRKPKRKSRSRRKRTIPFKLNWLERLWFIMVVLSQRGEGSIHGWIYETR